MYFMCLQIIIINEFEDFTDGILRNPYPIVLSVTICAFHVSAISCIFVKSTDTQNIIVMLDNGMKLCGCR